MRFHLLGPLTLADGHEAVVLQPSKPTVLLAALLLHANTVVSAEYLQRAVWGEEQPVTAKAALQTCVLRLRRLFTRHGVTGTVIEAVPGGYRITAAPDTLDLLGFREQVRRAVALSDDPDAELSTLRDALALWQGSLLSNVRSDLLHRDEVPRLAEERLRSVERVCDLLLRLGRCGEALVELWSATRAYPENERLREQLIEALYRTGRQTQALAEYRRVKEFLLDELGVDPSPSLQQLELAILRGEDLGTGHGPAALPAASPALTGEAGAPAGRAARPVPVVPNFTGREAETAAMTARLTAPAEPGEEAPHPLTVLVSGPPGIGKSALAHQVAHLVRDAFPGGRWLVPMTRPDGGARRYEDIAAEVSHALRAGPDGERVLLVLDDVVDAGQVRPLLPPVAGARGAVITTSRMGLAGLIATHGGWVHRLSAFTEAESYALLLSVLGAERVEGEPDAAHRLARLCGHFPFALRILTARLLTRPGLRLADAVGWLGADPLARLTLTDSPDISVRALLDGALNRLEPRLSEAFQLVAAAPGGTFGPDDSPAVPETVLEQLADAGLLEDGPPGPYRVHELLRSYVRRTAPEHIRRTEKV
ncbi:MULTISPECIES: BTAD domain-containing putative transcriptional regulator [unclassified Streptomyces]|uniref:BTAD domain-containing putative transcriptional regulator n=1 Tax=unclassified Streptomyces TaxID=2593676 RepID=UPI0037F4F3B7